MIDPAAELAPWLRPVALPSGLRLCVVPRPGFQQRVAVLVVSFGAADRRLALPGGETWELPPGVAHFLEHELFESGEGDLAERFARHGATANAWTSHDETAYHLATSEELEPGLELLLGLLAPPALSPARVERERRVIAQELSLHLDDPDVRVHRALLAGLYHRHPVRDEVAGTAAALERIDAALLERCHGRCYRPPALTLVCAGDLDPARVRGQVEAATARLGLDGAGAPAPRRLDPDEPRTVAAAALELDLPVALPRALVGWKDDPVPPGPLALARVVEAGLLVELLFGRSSDFFARHYAEGLLDGTFSAALARGRDHAYLALGGQTPEPDALLDAVEARVEDALCRGLDPHDLARLRNKARGRQLRAWNAVEELAARVVESLAGGWTLDAWGPALDAVTVEALEQRAASLFDPARRTRVSARPVD